MKSFEEIRTELGLENFSIFRNRAIAQFKAKFISPDTLLAKDITDNISCGKTTKMLVEAITYSQSYNNIVIKAYNNLITDVLVHKAKTYAEKAGLSPQPIKGLHNNQYLFLNKDTKFFLDHYNKHLFDYDKWIRS